MDNMETARRKDAKRKKLREARKDASEKTISERNWKSESIKKSRSRKHKKDKKKKKELKKQNKRKHKRNSSSDSSTDDSSSISSSSSSSSSDSSNEVSSSEDEKPRRKRKHSFKTKTQKKDKSFEEYHKSKNKIIKEPAKLVPTNIERESWMTESSLNLKTFTRDPPEKKSVAAQEKFEQYNPISNVRELNPYWKSNGTGLPAFKKPQFGSDDDESVPNAYNSTRFEGTKSWQKHSSKSEIKSADIEKHCSHQAGSASEITNSSESMDRKCQKPKYEVDNFLTDDQLNELSAKILKAEIMGNTTLASELKEKLEAARKVNSNIKANKLEHNQNRPVPHKKEEEHILLTRTDEKGNCWPLAKEKHSRSSHENEGFRKEKKKRMETHANGERVRYFADDDKYDLKQMFEREKYVSASDSNLQFAKITSKHKNPNDDVDDIFADKVRCTVSDHKNHEREVQRSINYDRRMYEQLQNCDKCFDSRKFEKEAIVVMGNKVYLALPTHVGIQTGHCMIIPIQHTSCCTQLDEDAWSEINDFRKALTRMFKAQKKDVIFFEIANKLHRHPHLSVHCIPIADDKAEMAPFYFKKAIEESEYEWSVNKQLISLKEKSLRSCIPKGLPYIWVHFGTDSGFAHVIEDEERFPRDFVLEIIGGMLNLNAKSWRQPRKEQYIKDKVRTFAERWKKFDCTE